MAQPGQTTIQLYSTTTTATTPSPSNLVSGELALNLTDKKVFSKDGSGNVVEMTLSPLNPSYTGTLTGGTGVVNLGSGQFVKDAAGNVGVGVTPSAWGGAYKAMQIGQSALMSRSGGSDLYLLSNNYFDGTNFRYINSTLAARYIQDAGQHQWFTAPSGTAGNPITFTTAMTLDTAGNFGLGVTPSAWNASYKALQVGKVGAFWSHGASTDVYLSANYFFDTAEKRIADGYATYYKQLNGAHTWATAASSTAGSTITFTTAMTLDASGNLIVGTASSLSTAAGRVDFTLNGSSSGGIISFGTAGVRKAYIYHDSTDLSINNEVNGVMRFLNNGSERARIDASGNLLVGATSGYSARTNIFSTADGMHIGVSAGSGAITSFIAGWHSSTSTSRGTLAFNITSNGDITNLNNSYGAISDAKLKENITDASPKLAKLMQVRIVNYNLKSDPDKTKLIGVVAQELEKVSPGLIEETKDYEEVKKTREVEVPATEDAPATTRTEEYTERVPLGTTTKSVKYSVFVPMLIKSLQEQQAQIEAMQTQLDEQNTAMQMLATRLAALEAAAT